jgi:hypothetical protein
MDRISVIVSCHEADMSSIIDCMISARFFSSSESSPGTTFQSTLRINISMARRHAPMTAE